MQTPSPRLPLLSGLRLLTNGAFRYLYPFLPVVAADLGLDRADAGILVSAMAVGGMTVPWVRGWLTGGAERTRLLLLAGILLTSIGVLGASLSPIAPVAVAFFIIIGAGKPLTDVASISYVSERIPYQRRARATSVMELTWAGGLIVVAPIAGLIAARTSWRIPLVLLAGLTLLALIPVRRQIDLDDLTSSRTAQAPPATRPPRWTAVEWQLLVVVALVFGMLEGTFSVFGLWMDADFGIGLEGLGGLAAASAIGELVGAFLVLAVADRFGKHRTAIAGMALCCLALLAIPSATTLPVAITALAFALCGSEIAIVAVLPLASEVQPQARTRFLAGMAASSSVGRAIAAFAGGLTFAAVGIGGNVAISITSGLLAIAALQFVVRREPRLRG